jgi:hypothetical protein
MFLHYVTALVEIAGALGQVVAHQNEWHGQENW